MSSAIPEGKPVTEEATLLQRTAANDAADKGHAHHRTSSSLSDFSLLELEHGEDHLTIQVVTDDVENNTKIPISSLVVVTETENLEKDHGESLIQDISDLDFEIDESAFKVSKWKGERFYSDYIAAGLKYKKQTANVVMLFESPSTSTDQSSFHNKDKYKFHDWPPPTSTQSKRILGPRRYASMNGDSFPVFLRDGTPPEGLTDHWKAAIPGYKPTSYVDKITEDDTVYAYLPVEQIRNHINDPQTHYHLAGKDAIHMMTQKTTKLLPDTRTVRPCVVKTTHSMGSKGIFIIRNDEDEKEFEQFLDRSGNPTFVVTDFVDIARNVACHFFIHPSGSIVWFGSNENHREADGSFSSDSYILMEHQERLKEMQLPFVEEVAQYCKGLGFWGFCGIDVLFDSHGQGFLVDINPRVTGSCPALMTLTLLSKKYGFSVGLFRRTGDIFYNGSPKELLERVTTYNTENEGRSRVVVHSMFQPDGKTYTKVNMGVYGNSLQECKTVLNSLAMGNPDDIA